MMPIPQALLSTVVFALVIFATRVFPFLLFSRRNPPKLLQFIERSIPPAVMAILVIYSLKDIPWQGNDAIAPAAALILAILLHLWKRNALLSIFGSTAVFMLLSSVV